MKIIKLLGIAAVSFATLALAGDDPVTQVAYTGTAGCTGQLRPKTKYAVQCTTDCYVRVTTSASIIPTAAADVYVTANRLYDVPTTNGQLFICAVQASSGGNLKVFINRDTRE